MHHNIYHNIYHIIFSIIPIFLTQHNLPTV